MEMKKNQKHLVALPCVLWQKICHYLNLIEMFLIVPTISSLYRKIKKPIVIKKKSISVFFLIYPVLNKMVKKFILFF